MIVVDTTALLNWEILLNGRPGKWVFITVTSPWDQDQIRIKLGTQQS